MGAQDNYWGLQVNSQLVNEVAHNGKINDSLFMESVRDLMFMWDINMRVLERGSQDLGVGYQCLEQE